MKNVRVITTDIAKKTYWEEKTVASEACDEAMQVLNVFPEVKEQTFRGFGGAFTEAAAHVYAGLKKEQKEEVINAYFGKEGLRYQMGRIHMNSCDFALGNYTYIEEGDVELKTFSIEHDRKEILPFILDAKKAAGEEIPLLVSPWSPPAFCKTNGEMNHGGSLKKEYYAFWADYFVRFIKEYQKEGMQIRYLTVQNEPAAVQTWDSCIYSGKEEGEFVRDYLGPKMKEAGLGDIKIFVWDHNKDLVYQRAKETMSVQGAGAYVDGVAVHWYTGDHFDGISLVKKQYPKLEVFFTEGCVEYSRFSDSNEVEKAEMYAHDMIGNLNAGISGSLDWNLLLDEKGGPNHVGNFCAAPLLCDVKKSEVSKQLFYYYIGHFSRYIRSGAVKIGTTRYTDAIDMTAFENPDKSIAIMLLNKTNQAQPYVLKEAEKGVTGELAPHSIQTILFEK
ncbi:glycoside hydrolase family 30 protein [Roseburia sp. 831b]|uniref:glycoside hydrolase family 30 protein n=1 Tax=Roseburia sp. 831b TaxID=1261635 RepID=UPI0009534993|nr:glycoside hydrolase family 30 beta sandwich domain-containing protein [Roseburia sp. 831b]WVK73621.1 glycoside hydrolase family 30 beta sandwich domain-containing protein [Roseburia sp. 831b]